jgi:PAS domain S-box-containing protein
MVIAIQSRRAHEGVFVPEPDRVTGTGCARQGCRPAPRQAARSRAVTPIPPNGGDRGATVDTQTIPAELTTFFEGSHIALALAAATGDNVLLLVNERFHRLTGYTGAEIIGHNCRLLQRDAENREARAKIHTFLTSARQDSVRTPILNFRKDGTPFVNLLYMSKLKALSGEVRFLFASQFDVSRSQPELLSAYDAELGRALTRLTPTLAESGLVIEGSLMTIANTVATVAQAKLTLADLDAPGFP